MELKYCRSFWEKGCFQCKCRHPQSTPVVSRGVRTVLNRSPRNRGTSTDVPPSEAGWDGHGTDAPVVVGRKVG